MSHLAIVMAGGEGSRLRPLTCDLPKPMTPLLNRPVLDYTLELLSRHGFSRACLTLQYLPEVISRHFSNECRGVQLRYCREREPLGTAGGVRHAIETLPAPIQDTFAVLSGDGLTDFDLTRALHFHREKGALATLLLTRVPNPLSYGVVLSDENGRVVRFVEKPGWGEVYSDTVNTGIYLLEPQVLAHIPQRGSYDFGKDLFPRLVSQGLPIYSFVADGYWCDIGDQSAYVQSQADLLDGRVQLSHPSGIAEDAKIGKNVRLSSKILVGSGAVIEDGAVLDDHVIIGNGCIIGKGARLSRSVLWDHVRIGSGAELKGCVVCRHAQIGEDARLLEDSAAGTRARLGRGVQLSFGARVWPGKQVDHGMELKENLVWGSVARPELKSGAAPVSSPEEACLFSAAWLETVCSSQRRIALGHDDTPCARALYSVISGAICARSAQPFCLGALPLPTLRKLQRMLSLPGGLYISERGLIPCAAEGIPPSRSQQRSLEALCARQDYSPTFLKDTQLPVFCPDAFGLYAGALSISYTPGVHQPSPVIIAADSLQSSLAQTLLTLCGLPGRVTEDENTRLAPGETGFLLSPDAQSVRMFDSLSTPDESQQMMLTCLCLSMENHPTWVLPLDAPLALEEIAHTCGVEIQRVSCCREHWASSLIRQNARQFDLWFDGFYRILRLCSLLSFHQTDLQGLLSLLPRVFEHLKTLDCALTRRGMILRRLCEGEGRAQLEGGLRALRPEGCLTVWGQDSNPSLLIRAESTNMETAQELCDEMEKKIQNLLQNPIK